MLSALDGSERWTQLLDKNPFVPGAPAKTVAPEPPPAYEFRGRSVENGVEYFSLFNLETKKALWVTRKGGELKVKDYSITSGLELVDPSGRNIRLALKQASPSRGGFSAAVAAPAVTAPIKAMPSPPAAAASASEVQRLEQLAGEIRARRAQRQQLTSRG